MQPTLEKQTANEAFFQPRNGLAAWSAPARACPEVSDEHYMLMGVQRVLEACESGRAFWQEHGSRQAQPLSLANYFASLHSARRGVVLQEVNRTVLAAANVQWLDLWRTWPNWPAMKSASPTATGTKPPRMTPGMKASRWQWAISTT